MSFLRRLFRGREPREPREPETHDDAEEPTPGWDAITARLDERYGDQEPVHWGTIIGWRIGGPDPLDGTSAYRNDGPPTHWHYASYGLSELYEKESEDAARSGWGIELTFRLARPPGVDQAEPPPVWPVAFLQNLAREVFERGNVFWPGHYLDAHGPIALEVETDIRAAVFVDDPDLGSIDTPNGTVRFVQVVGITLDEFAAIRRWDCDAVVDLLGRDNPLLVTDLQRQSILRDPRIAAEVDLGIRTDGSSMGGVYVDRLGWPEDEDGLRVNLGALAIEDLRIVLEGRLANGREGFLEGPTGRLDLVPGEALAWHQHRERDLGLVLPPEAVVAMAKLPVAAGVYRWPEASRLTLEVEQTIVRDQDGKEISRIG